MKSAAEEYQLMSESLRTEVRTCVDRGETFFKPSSGVVREAVQFVRPRSQSLVFIRLVSGPVAGWDGDGKLDGIGIAPELVEHIKSTE